MEKSNSIINLSKALITFHVKVDKIKKDAKNPFFKSSYASLSNILDSINTPLIEAGLTFSQLPTGENGLTTIVIHGESGEFLQATYDMRPVKDDPQGRGSVITYQRRYALASVLGLNIDDDDDANTGTHGGKTPEQAEDNNKPWLNKGSKEFDAVVKRLQAGTATVKQIREHYKVSKTMEAELNQITLNHQPA